MKQKKKKSSKIIIIAIIIVIILIIGIGFAYAYLATDLLKSNKKLFFNYISQIGDTTGQSDFIETNLINYFEKKKNTPYTNNGEFYANITLPEEYMPNIQPTNSMNIAFNGQVDSNTEKATQNISINYSSDVKFEFLYKKIGNVYGLQNDYVGKKYIAVDTKANSNSSISELQENISKIENVTNSEINIEEVKQILEKYVNILDQELQDSNFSKIQENNEIGYKLSLSWEQCKNIIVKILETAQNDQELLQKINQQLSSNYTANDIKGIIDEVNNYTELNEKTIEITVYQNARKTTRMVIVVDTFKIELTKNNEAGELQYNISLEQQDAEEVSLKAYINLKFTGLATMQNISEKYEVGIEFPVEGKNCSYTYNLDNDVTFAESSNIGEFTDDDCLNLNTLGEEQAETLINAISERLQLVNQEQMEQLGLSEDANPLTNMMPTLLFDRMGITTSSNEMNQLTQAEITTFNSQYELYEGTNLTGATVKGLLTTISQNNGLDDESEDGKTNSEDKTKNTNRLIQEINFNGEECEVNLQNLTIIRGEIVTEDHYRVEFEKNEAGAIYRVVINKR